MSILLTESTFNDSVNRKRRRMGETEECAKKPVLSRDNTPVSFMFNPASQVRLNMVAPDFNCAAIIQHEIGRFQLSSLFSTFKAVVLFFYEGDFTPISCKDLSLIHHNFERFQSLGAIPVAISTDTEMVHKAFVDQSSLGFDPSFPLVSDTTRSVSRHFNVINSETGMARRAAFVIDNTRQIRFSFVLEDNRLSHSMDTICTILHTF
ncbi:thioredoxin-like protein [Choanephora cucurbitarum]|nr:thioredoxin-like protein [Choanephora cucurbitarum]